MSTNLDDLRVEIVTAIRLGDPQTSNVYEDDPREEINFLPKLLKGNVVKAWLIEEFNPSAVAVIDTSDYTADATIVGLFPIADNSKRLLQDRAQKVIRWIRDIAFNRSAVVAGIENVVVADRYACYKITISAEFYALQTLP